MTRSQWQALRKGDVIRYKQRPTRPSYEATVEEVRGDYLWLSADGRMVSTRQWKDYELVMKMWEAEAWARYTKVGENAKDVMDAVLTIAEERQKVRHLRDHLASASRSIRYSTLFGGIYGAAIATCAFLASRDPRFAPVWMGFSAVAALIWCFGVGKDLWDAKVWRDAVEGKE